MSPEMTNTIKKVVIGALGMTTSVFIAGKATDAYNSTISSWEAELYPEVKKNFFQKIFKK